jgi:Di-N-acetylchitobiase
VVSDLLYVMVYDIQSQIITTSCIAGANSPHGAMIRGIQRYIELGIQPRQLVLGIPWYGYGYPCVDGMKPNDRFCPLQ